MTAPDAGTPEERQGQNARNAMVENWQPKGADLAKHGEVSTKSGYTPDPADVELVARAMYDDQRGAGRYDGSHRAGQWHQEARDHATSALSALAATGRLRPPGSRKLSDEWAVRVTREAGDTTIRHEGDPYVNHRRAEQIADSARSHPTVAAAEPVTREVWVGPWLPAPTTTDIPTNQKERSTWPPSPTPRSGPACWRTTTRPCSGSTTPSPSSGSS